MFLPCSGWIPYTELEKCLGSDILNNGILNTKQTFEHARSASLDDGENKRTLTSPKSPGFSISHSIGNHSSVSNIQMVLPGGEMQRHKPRMVSMSKDFSENQLNRPAVVAPLNKNIQQSSRLPPCLEKESEEEDEGFDPTIGNTNNRNVTTSDRPNLVRSQSSHSLVTSSSIVTTTTNENIIIDGITNEGFDGDVYPSADALSNKRYGLAGINRNVPQRLGSKRAHIDSLRLTPFSFTPLISSSATDIDIPLLTADNNSSPGSISSNGSNNNNKEGLKGLLSRRSSYSYSHISCQLLGCQEHGNLGYS